MPDKFLSELKECEQNESDSGFLRKAARIVEKLPLEDSATIANWLEQAAEFSDNLS